MGWMSAPKPDPAMTQIAQDQMQLSREALDWYRSIYERDLKPAQEQDQAMRQQLIQQFLTDSALQREFAREQQDYYRQNVRPLGEQVMRDAQNFDSDENIARRQGIAGAAVTQAFSNAREQENRNLSRFGVNPNSGKFADINARLANQEALGVAGARTGAAFDTEREAAARRSNAFAQMQGLPQQTAAFYGLSNQSLNSASGNSLAGLEGMRANAGFGGMGFNVAGGLNSSAANIFGQRFNAEQAGFDSRMRLLAGLGQAAGTAVGMYASSKDLKEGKKPVKDGKALRGIKELDIDSWNYKGDPEPHVGPYAEDFKREFGLGTGKAISVQDAIGVTMKAVQDLAGEVEDLKGKRGIRKANGGKVHKGKGKVKGPGGPVDDKIPAMLSNGEYVLPADTVQKLGVKNLDDIVKKTHVPAEVQRGLRRSK